MATMTAAQRALAFDELQGDISRARTSLAGLTKADWRAAVDAADQWASDNAASFNAAIPQPARGALPAPLKAQLLAAVILARFKNGV